MIGIIWVLIGVILLGFYNGLLLADDKLPELDPKNKSLEFDTINYKLISNCIMQTF
jgi:hypothetical protein